MSRRGPALAPRLPFAPLRAYIESIGGPAAVGWAGASHPGGSEKTDPRMRYPNEGRAYYRAAQEGDLTVWQADRLACALGTHPSLIWGAQWWLPEQECA